MECDYHIVPRSRLGIIAPERFVDQALAHNCKDSRNQMAVYVSSLVVKMCPAFETGLGVVHGGAIPMADAIVVLVP